MNRSDLVVRVAIEAGLSQRQAAVALEVVLEAIQGAVASGERVTLPGFGTFEPRDRAARKARNPRTGEPVAVPATTVPAFRPSEEFRDAVSRRAQRRGRKSLP